MDSLPSSGRPRRQRPLGVTVLVIIELLSAILIAIGLTEGSSVSMPLVSTEDEPVGAAIAAVIGLALAFGLWRLNRWAWTGMMLWHGLILATGLVAYLRGEQPFLELAISVVVVFYLNQSEVQRAFRRHDAPAHAEPSS